MKYNRIADLFSLNLRFSSWMNNFLAYHMTNKQTNICFHNEHVLSNKH